MVLLLARKWQQAHVWLACLLACCSGRERLPCLCPHYHDNSPQLDFTSWLRLETLDSASTPRPDNSAALNFNMCKKFCLHGYTCRWIRTPQPAGEARSSYGLRPSDPPNLPNRIHARSAPAPELQYRALSACHAAEKAGTTFGLLCFDVLEAYGHTKDTLPRAWLNAWVNYCQQPAGKALGVKGPIARCLTLGRMALFLLYTSRCQHVQSASSEPHVASQECSSICPNLKPVPARYLSGWLGALVPSSPLQPYCTSWQSR